MNRFKELEKMPGVKKVAGCRKHGRTGIGNADVYFPSTQEVEAGVSKRVNAKVSLGKSVRPPTGKTSSHKGS